MRHNSRNCNPAQDLVFSKLIFQPVFLSRGVIFSQTPVGPSAGASLMRYEHGSSSEITARLSQPIIIIMITIMIIIITIITITITITITIIIIIITIIISRFAPRLGSGAGRPGTEVGVAPPRAVRPFPRSLGLFGSGSRLHPNYDGGRKHLAVQSTLLVKGILLKCCRDLHTGDLE